MFDKKFGSFGTGDGQFINPFGVAVDSSDNIVVADTGNNRIQIFDSSGGFIKKFGSFGAGDGQFKSPFDVTFDSSGNIVVADRFNHRIQIFDSSGGFIKKFGSFGAGDGQFKSPFDVTFDSSGNLVVADTDNHRIQVFEIINQPPEAIDDSAQTLSNVSLDIDVLSNDSDPDRDSLTIDSTSNGPSNGIATINAGMITYTPNAGFAGADSFDYTISDGNGGQDTAIVIVTVTSPEEAIQIIIDKIISFNFPTSVENLLIKNLPIAINNLNDGNPNNDRAVCEIIDSFINKVDQREMQGQLTSAQADESREQANAILASLGC